MQEDANVLDERALGEISGGTTRVNLPIIRYTVAKGDTLRKLAKRFSTTVEAILRLNPTIANKDRIETGWTLRIPDQRS